jgi:hypothetical protein
MAKIELGSKMSGASSVETLLGRSFNMSTAITGSSGQIIGAPRLPKPTLKITDISVKKG